MIIIQYCHIHSRDRFLHRHFFKLLVFKYFAASQECAAPEQLPTSAPPLKTAFSPYTFLNVHKCVEYLSCFIACVLQNSKLDSNVYKTSKQSFSSSRSSSTEYSDFTLPSSIYPDDGSFKDTQVNNYILRFV